MSEALIPVRVKFQGFVSALSVAVLCSNSLKTLLNLSNPRSLNQNKKLHSPDRRISFWLSSASFIKSIGHLLFNQNFVIAIFSGSFGIQILLSSDPSLFFI